MDRSNFAAMTAWEYAQYLQDQAFGDQKRPVTANICDLLAVNLLGSLPPNHRHYLERVPIIVLPTGDPNGWTIRGPAGHIVIAIDYGLMSLLATLNKLVLNRLNIFGFEPSLEMATAAERAQQTVRYFCTKEGKIPRWPTSPRKMLIASALSNIQTTFVVGHELGHIVLGHLESEAVGKVQQVGYPTMSLLSYNKMHDEEHGADKFAAKLMLEHFAKQYDALFGSNEPGYAPAGIHILFSYFELVASVAGEPSETPTHPSSAIRQSKLRDYIMTKMPEQSRHLATAADAIVQAWRTDDDKK